MDCTMDLLRDGEALRLCRCGKRPAMTLQRRVSGSSRKSHVRRRPLCADCILRWASLRVMRCFEVDEIPTSLLDVFALGVGLRLSGGQAVPRVREEEPVIPARSKSA